MSQFCHENGFDVMDLLMGFWSGFLHGSVNHILRTTDKACLPKRIPGCAYRRCHLEWGYDCEVQFHITGALETILCAGYAKEQRCMQYMSGRNKKIYWWTCPFVILLIFGVKRTERSLNFLLIFIISLIDRKIHEASYYYS